MWIQGGAAYTIAGYSVGRDPIITTVIFRQKRADMTSVYIPQIFHNNLSLNEKGKTILAGTICWERQAVVEWLSNITGHLIKAHISKTVKN